MVALNSREAKGQTLQICVKGQNRMDGIKQASKVAQSCPTLRPHGPWPTWLLRPWDFPGKNTGVGCHFLLQGIFPTQGLNPGLPHCRQTLYPLSHQGSPMDGIKELLILTELLQVRVLSRLSHFRLFATPWTVAHQAPLSIGFPRQEYWSGLFASPGDLPDPRIKPISLVSPALQAGSLSLAPPRKLSG